VCGVRRRNLYYEIHHLHHLPTIPSIPRKHRFFRVSILKDTFPREREREEILKYIYICVVFERILGTPFHLYDSS
jgi:hypothetical protein